MKRRNFFKGIGLVGAAAYVNPFSLIKKPNQPRKVGKGMSGIVDLDAKHPTMIYDLHSPELIKAAKDWMIDEGINIEDYFDGPIDDKDLAGRLLQHYWDCLSEHIEVMYLLMGGIRFINRKTLRKPKWDDKKGWLSDNLHFSTSGRYLEFTPALEGLVYSICAAYGVFYEGNDDEDYLSGYPFVGFSFIYSHQELAKPTNRYFNFGNEVGKEGWIEI